MYRYVDKKLIAQYKSHCEELLSILQHNIREKYGITMKIILIGSGAQNLVTRNGKEPFDLDYNLVIQKLPKEYQKDLKRLKDIFRHEADRVLADSFSCGGDSRHSLRYHKTENGRIIFRLDLAIHYQQANTTVRLGRTKDGSSWCWEARRDNSVLIRKASMIKGKLLWDRLREIYLAKKNLYLSRQDYDHISSVVYVEAVNELLQTLKK